MKFQKLQIAICNGDFSLEDFEPEKADLQKNVRLKGVWGLNFAIPEPKVCDPSKVHKIEINIRINIRTLFSSELIAFGLRFKHFLSTTADTFDQQNSNKRWSFFGGCRWRGASVERPR